MKIEEELHRLGLRESQVEAVVRLLDRYVAEKLEDACDACERIDPREYEPEPPAWMEDEP